MPPHRTLTTYHRHFTHLRRLLMPLHCPSCFRHPLVPLHLTSFRRLLGPMNRLFVSRRRPLMPLHCPFYTSLSPFNTFPLTCIAFPSLFNASPPPFDDFSSPDHFTLMMFNSSQNYTKTM